MAAIINTAVGNSKIEPKRIVVDMSETIAFLEPSANPLVVLTKKLNTSVCHQPKYEWMDNNLDVRWTATSATVTNVATSVPVTAGTGQYFAADDLVKNATTGELFKVSSIATDTLTVVRGISNGGTGTAMGSGDKLLIVGNSSMQGSGAPAEKVVGVTPYFNYTQIFKTAFSITKTLDATTLYGMKELARLRKLAGIKHAKDLEYAFLFGSKSQDTTGAQPVTTTEGIYTTLAANANVATATISKGSDTDAVAQGKLMTFCEKIFTYGGDTRTCLCSPDVLSWFATLANNKVQLIQNDNDKTLGLSVTRYATPHGILNLVLHPLLINGYGGKMLALSTDDIYYRPLQGRDTKLTTNVQLPDEDGQRDMYLTEAGVEIRLPLKHGLLSLTA